MGFLGDSEGKKSACNVGNWGLILGLGRSPGEGNGYPLQYSCLVNSMDRGVWQVHENAKRHGLSELTLSHVVKVECTNWYLK